MTQVYVYAWGNNDRRAALKGRLCVVEATGRMRTVLIRFLDTGERVTTSIRALRKVKVFLSEIAISGENGGGGNRTRVTSHPDAAITQDFSRAASADEPRPRLCNRDTRVGAAPADASGVPADRAPMRTAKAARDFPLNAAGLTTGEDASPTRRSSSHSLDRPHAGGGSCAARRSQRSFRNQCAARVRTHADARHLAFGGGVAGARFDRPAGVGLGSVRVLPVASRLLVSRVVVVRDPAGESVPARVGCRRRRDVVDEVRAGQVADRVREAQVRLTVRGARVPACARLVLTPLAVPNSHVAPERPRESDLSRIGGVRA